jgi:hypothetical protein
MRLVTRETRPLQWVVLPSGQNQTVSRIYAARIRSNSYAYVEVYHRNNENERGGHETGIANFSEASFRFSRYRIDERSKRFTQKTWQRVQLPLRGSGPGNAHYERANLWSVASGNFLWHL